MSYADLTRALLFAAERHRDQRRRDQRATPYINHPIAVAHLLASEAGIEDIVVLQAAVLHDVLEDSPTSYLELVDQFGPLVADVVREVTDDTTLPREQRKALQVQRAPSRSPDAAVIKVADKTVNLRDIVRTPPVDWTVQRRLDYFDWAKLVVEALPPVSTTLRLAFDAAYAGRRYAASAEPAAARSSERR